MKSFILLLFWPVTMLWLIVHLAFQVLALPLDVFLWWVIIQQVRRGLEFVVGKGRV